MKRHLILLITVLIALVQAKAQYYSINYDQETVAKMSAAFNTEALSETYYAEQVSKIREHYQAAELAAAGIYSSKYLDRKALTNMGIWTNSTENYYYRRIYNMVSAKIMPKIWTVSKMMLKDPHNAMNWGSYIYKVCNETKSLCYQFESVVTNSSLSFKDISFLEINPELSSLFKFSEYGNTDWSTLLDNLSNTGSSSNKQAVQADVDNLYALGVSLAAAGASKMVGSLLSKSKFNSAITSKASSVLGQTDNFYATYCRYLNNTGSNLLSAIGGEEGIDNLFSTSNYDASGWQTDYAKEEMGQYYTQRWYIYKQDKGSISLCDYYPPTEEKAILNGNHWKRYKTSDTNFYPDQAQTEEILFNSESHAGWSRQKVQEQNLSNDGNSYSIQYSRHGYSILKKDKLQSKAYAYEIHVTQSWNHTETVYEDVFDSYSMDLATFQASLNARLSDFNDNEDGSTYYIGSDAKHYYQATTAQKIAGCELATISVTCHDGAKLAEGTTQYKCRKCSNAVNDHTKQCVMNTSVSESDFDTSEIDEKISEVQSQISALQTQIDALEQANAALAKLISKSSTTEAVYMRQQYNINQDRITSLQSEQKSLENDIAQLQQAKKEAIEGEDVQTDDYYRIPAIMQDCKTAYGLTWNGAGSWEGDSYVRTASMPNINGAVTFTATISIARKPKYFLGIKIHRAIVQIAWKLTAEYTDTQVIAILNLDPDSSDEGKADKVNSKLAEVAKDYPNCDPNVEYARSTPVEEDDTDDTHHLLWSSDRLEIAREVDTRLTKIYADLVSLEKMMSYKHSFIDALKGVLPHINDEAGRRLTIIEQCRERWMHRALNPDNYQKDEDDE